MSSLTIDGGTQVSLNATWTRLLAREGGRVHLHDLRRGGAPVADLSAGGAPGAESARFLRDGRIARLVSRPAGRELWMLDADGVRSRPTPVVRFDGPGGISFVGETAAGRIVLQVSAPRRDRQLVLVDLARGTASRLPQGLTPMQPPASSGDPQLPRATLYSRHGDMIWFDPDTNRERLLAHLPSDRSGAAR